MNDEHKLNDEWCIYFHIKNIKKSYAENTIKLIEFDTIKNFWNIFNNIPKPSNMFSELNLKKKIKGTNDIPGGISVFRKNSFPSWENHTNINGFEWSIRKYKDFEEINNLWKLVLINIIGENFEYSEILNGARIVDSSIDNKIIYRIEIWFSDKKFKEYFECKIKDILNLPHYTKLLYREHSTLKEIRA